MKLSATAIDLMTRARDNFGFVAFQVTATAPTWKPPRLERERLKTAESLANRKLFEEIANGFGFCNGKLDVKYAMFKLTEKGLKAITEGTP